MKTPQSFSPVVCVVGFHHARYISHRSSNVLTKKLEADTDLEDLRSRAGLAPRMEWTQRPTMTGHISRLWHYQTERMRESGHSIAGVYSLF